MAHLLVHVAPLEETLDASHLLDNLPKQLDHPYDHATHPDLRKLGVLLEELLHLLLQHPGTAGHSPHLLKTLS